MADKRRNSAHGDDITVEHTGRSNTPFEDKSYPTSNDDHGVEGIEYDQFTLAKKPWAYKVTPFERIIKHKYEGKGTKEDPFQVTWIEDDPENPLEMATTMKWVLCFYASFSTLCISFTSSAYSGAVRSIKEELGGSEIVITLGISLYVLGFALGPLFWSPISEVYGRRACLLISFAFFTLWNAVSIASPNIAALVTFRFLAGAFGSSPLTNAGGSLADVFRAKERGLAITLYASCPFLGPAIGPIIGGFLGESAGWKWLMGLVAIYAGVVTVMGIFMNPETYAPVLLRKRAALLSKVTGKLYLSKPDIGKDVSLSHLFKVALIRPWLLLIYEPIVLLLSLYQAVVYAILYSFFSAFPIVFEQVRGWSPGIGGLAFLGIMIGFMFGIVLQLIWVNPAYSKKVDEYGGIMAPPEERMPQAMIGAVALVFGLAVFSATDFPSIHWIVPIIFSAPAGFGMVLIFISLQSYLIDAYLLYAAAVLAASCTVRSVLGAAFPILAPYMYNPGGPNGKCPTESCGIHVGPGIAAFLALIFVPAPWYFYKYGPKIRKRCRYAAEADKLLQSMLNPGSQDAEEIKEAIREIESDPTSSDDIEKQKNQQSPKKDNHDIEEEQEHLHGSDDDSVKNQMRSLSRQMSYRSSRPTSVQSHSDAEGSLHRVPSYV